MLVKSNFKSRAGILKRSLFTICFLVLFLGCVSLPKETVLLSENIGNDLVEFRKSHLNLVSIHFKNLKNEVNMFVDDVYAPFIINYVLKDELDIYRDGGVESLYYTLIKAGDSSDPKASAKALEEMTDFLVAARDQIEEKRKELLLPLINQENLVKEDIKESYANTMYANSVLTAHLRSVRKLKDTQSEALAIIGLDGLNTTLTNKLSEASNQISSLTEKAEEIDVNAEDAFERINDISEKIKGIFNDN